MENNSFSTWDSQDIRLNNKRAFLLPINKGKNPLKNKDLKKWF